MRTAPKVVLFVPAHAGKVFGPPLSLMTLASPLREAGFSVCIIDGVLHTSAVDAVEAELADCLCVGISVLTGPAILDAIAVAERVKKVRPEVPVIFGGWHPSLSPAQTMREEFVDVLVRHQGEQTLVEIARRLAEGKGLDFVEGCWFKRGGKVIQNADRHTIPIGGLPLPAYDLVDLDAYEALVGRRVMPYATSVGCPYACNYCTDQVFYGRRVNSHSAERAAKEMVALAERYRVEEFALVDSNFLVDTRRAAGIARALKSAGAGFTWSFQASTDLLCRMTDEDVRLMYDGGLRHIGFGTESGSESVLKGMNKAHQKVPDLYEAARKCEQAGIRVTYNLIFGYPGETAEHRRETWRVMSGITDRFSNVSFSPNVFTPYPGIPIWEELERLGLREPQSLAEWAKVDLGQTELPWLPGGSNAGLEREVAYLVLGGEVSKAVRRRAGSVMGLVLGVARKAIAWRMRSSWFGWPVELWAAQARRWLVLRRSLLTGRAVFERS